MVDQTNGEMKIISISTLISPIISRSMEGFPGRAVGVTHALLSSSFNHHEIKTN
jgi:hypothetical protein